MKKSASLLTSAANRSNGTKGFCKQWISFLLPVVVMAFCGVSHAQEAYPIGYESTLVYQGLSAPAGVAVDTKGNVYIADYSNNRVVLETFQANGTYVESAIGTGLLTPYGVAVDAAGNVFVADTGNGRVVKETPAGGGAFTQTVVMNAGNTYIKNPTGIAVDAADNLYLTDTNTGNVVQLTAANNYGTENLLDSTTAGSGVATNTPYGVAVDSSSNVFIADVVQGVIEVPWTGSSYGTTSIIGSGISSPKGVAVDLQNNVYVANTGTGQVYEEVLQFNGSYTQQIIDATGLTSVDSIAVDNRSNIYVSVPSADKVIELSPFNGNFGNVNIGSTSPNITISFQFLQPGTLSQVLATQKGNNNGEFSIVSGGTCTVGSSFNQGDSCSVIVNFKPQYAGTRYGSVELMNSYNELFGTAYIFGTGVGPQLVFLPGVTNQVASGYVPGGNYPGLVTMAVDGSDNLFYTDWDDNYWHEATAASNYGTVFTSSGYIQTPSDVQTDGAGNVYVTDYQLGVIYKFFALDGYQTYISMDTGLNNPTGSAIDGNGNVYVTASGSNSVYEIIASSDYTQIVNVANGFNNPSDLGVDGSGDVFVLNFGNGTVSEVFAVNGSVPANPTVQTIVSGLQNPQSIKVDNVGNLYIADWHNNAVEEWTVASGYATELVIVNVRQPSDIAIDGQGNLFYNSGKGSTTGFIYEISEGTPPTLFFSGTNNPQTVSILNIGNESLTFPALNGGNNPSISNGFTWDTSQGTDCQLAPYSLAIQTQCNYPVSYNPASGASTGQLILTDNTLYQQAPNYGQQTIQLNATGLGSTMTVTADSYSIPFGQALPTYGYQLNGPQGATMCTGKPNLSTSPANPTAIGTYPITITKGTLNCGAQYTSYVWNNGTLTITKQVVYLTLTTTNAGPIFYGSPIPNLQNNYTLTGFVNGDSQASVCTGAPVISTLATGTSPVGTYTILGDVGSLVCSGDPNVSYSFNVVNAGSLTIQAEPITVTANSLSITYGATPSYTSTTVPSPLPSVCAGTIQYTLGGHTPQNPIEVNTYSIIPSGLNCGSNYKITYKNGTLTVSKDTPIVTITPNSLPYGGSIGSLTYTAANSNNSTDVTAGGSWSYTWNGVSEPSGYKPNGPGTLCAVWKPKNSNIPGTNPKLKYSAEYNPSASTCITVSEQATITYSPQPNSIPYGTGLVAAQLGNAVTVTYNNQNITADGTSAFVYNGVTIGVGYILPAGTDSICVTWTPTPAYQSTYSPASTCSNIIVNASNTYVTYTPTPSTITFGTGLVGTQLNAQAFIQNVNTNVTADGTFTYTWNGNNVGLGYVLPVGTQTICASWTPSPSYSADLLPSSLCQTINVTPSLTVTATPVSITYGATPSFTYTTNPSPMPAQCTGTVVFAVTPSPAYTPDPVAGYTITPSGITCTGGYTINYVTGSLTVSKDAPTVTYSNASIPYGTALSSIAVTAVNSNNSTNVLSGGTLSYTWAGTSEPATFIPPYGTGQLCVTWTPNASLISGTSLAYSSEYSATTNCQNITVTQGLLTITATPGATAVYGSTLPNSTYTYVITGFVGNDGSGFLGNDGPSGATFGGSNVVCSGAPVLSTPVDGQTNPYPSVGIYTVGVSTTGFACTGYLFKINTGELHITPATLTIQPVAVSQSYDSQVPTYQYQCLLNGTLLGTNNCGAGVTAVTGTPGINATATIRASSIPGVVYYTSNVGTYSLKASLGSLKSATGDYTFSFQPNTLTLTTSPQSLTVQPYSITMYQSTCLASGVPAPAYKITGLLNWDTQASTTTGAPVLSIPTYTGNCAKGTYTIQSATGTLALDVYNGQTDYSGIIYGTATLTIK